MLYTSVNNFLGAEKNLGQLICPLCGRFVSLTHFDPSKFDLDIYGVNVTGLGRGKGVKVTGTYSILHPGDTTIELIKDRILELSKVLIENRCLKPEEVLSNLKITAINPREVQRLKGEVDALKVELQEASKEKNRLRLENENLESRVNENKKTIRILENEVATLETEFEASKEQLRRAESERNRWKTEAETLEVKIEELEEAEEEETEEYDRSEIINMTERIEEVLATGGGEREWGIDKEENTEEALKERVNALINEYEALEAETEQNDRAN